MKSHWVLAFYSSLCCTDSKEQQMSQFEIKLTEQKTAENLKNLCPLTPGTDIYLILSSTNGAERRRQ